MFAQAMCIVDGSGNIIAQPTLQDYIAWIPCSELIPLVVSGEAYANPIAISTHIACLRATDSGSGSTAIIQADLASILSRTTAGKGIVINSATVYWTLTVQALTTGPSATVETAVFGAAAAAAAAPTVSTTAGGTITTYPASTQTAVPTANQFYGTRFILGTPLAINSAVTRAFLEMSFPNGVSSVLYVAGVSVAFNNTPI